MEYHIFGDTGGHYDALSKSLIKLGVDITTGAIPKDHIIVTVGDVIHKGPQSAETLKLVDLLIRRNPSQFIYIIGNHEMLHFSGQVSRNSSYCKCSDADVDMLLALKSEKRLRYAYAFISEGESYLVTHAGLTEGFWREHLNYEGDAFVAADLINKLPDETLNMVSYLKTGEYLMNATPVWAVCDAEVGMSWVRAELEPPFHMVHGHTTILNWDDNSIYSWSLSDKTVLSCSVLDFINRFQYIHLGTKQVIGVDPTYWYETLPEGTAQPYMTFTN